MLGFIQKFFGGSKSEKDVKIIQPLVGEINQHFNSYQALSNDQLRSKTQDFRTRIKSHLSQTDQQISDLNKQAEELPFSDIVGKDTIYQEVDKIKKDRDKLIEEVLKEILPEAFAVVKETARRFKENSELSSSATDKHRRMAFPSIAGGTLIDMSWSRIRAKWAIGVRFHSSRQKGASPMKTPSLDL